MKRHHQMLQSQPGYAMLTPPKISRFLDDPRGPETLLLTLTVGELAAFTDALYRNLDTPFPEPGVHELYELAVEEAHRRSARPTALTARLSSLSPRSLGRKRHEPHWDEPPRLRAQPRLFLPPMTEYARLAVRQPSRERTGP